ncbi:MAG: Rieske 2Fe-2S domain-containing protein [Chloroflexi bacterium]|nr:Rieske 2Fe-2S domain-containing protein [Chloroflexota bacterium]
MMTYRAGQDEWEEPMLTTEENARVTRVGADTPMGELLRRYWYPIAASVQLRDRGTRPVRLLGENLVLFRDRSGNLGLIGEKCPHRRAGMVFGVPEAEGLRCAYHGWLWAADGRCLEQPYETTEDSASSLRDRVSIAAYPVQEKAGLIFAYLGPQPAPLIPNWDLFVWTDVVRDIGTAVVPCNWLQIMENSLDPVHVEWLHTYFSGYVLERLGRPDLNRGKANYGKTPWRHTKIGFDVFDYGIVKRRLLEGMTEDDDGWSVGHPILFPTILRTGTSFQIRVPIDDTHTQYFWYNCHKPRPGVLELRQQDPLDTPIYEVPVPGLDGRGEPEWHLVDNNSGQDLAMWYTQGPVTDREEEHLGASDRGVALYRKLLELNLVKVAQGQDPMNVFRDPATNVCIEIQTETALFNRGDPSRISRAGQSGKYSPILREAARKLEGERTLLEPVR